MKYSEPLRAQLLVVFVFLGVGFLLGVWYLICSFLRKLAYEKRSVTFLSDILFFCDTESDDLHLIVFGGPIDLFKASAQRLQNRLREGKHLPGDAER